MILQKVVGHRSLSMFVSKSQLGIAELNENGLQRYKARFEIRLKYTTRNARLHTFS